MLWRIAWRYIIGKKSTQAIQIISWVSILAMAVGTACLLIVLSVFNGFDGFIKGLYSDYYAEAKISPITGTHFLPGDELLLSLQNNKQIQQYARVLEEKILLVYDQGQAIANLKGVDTMFPYVNKMESHIKYGMLNLHDEGELPNIHLGIGLSNKLSANDESALPVKAYLLKDNFNAAILNPEDAYTSMLFMVRGVFVLQEDLDNQLAITNLNNVQALLEKPNQLSSIEIKLQDAKQFTKLKAALQPLLKNSNLKIEDRLEQNKTLYFILQSERVAVFAVLSFMLFIASFNIMGSLSMLIIEKEKDIAILQSMGLTPNQIQRLFLYCGILLSLLGAVIGAFIAILLCVLQQQFGFITLGGANNFLIEAYPVSMRLQDFVSVIAVVVGIALLASFLPSKKVARKNLIDRIKAE